MPEPFSGRDHVGLEGAARGAGMPANAIALALAGQFVRLLFSRGPNAAFTLAGCFEGAAENTATRAAGLLLPTAIGRDRTISDGHARPRSDGIPAPAQPPRADERRGGA